MKKFLAVLLSAVLCATVAYSACAEEATDGDATPKTTQTDLESVVDSLKNDEQAQKLAGQIADAVKTGAAKNDVADLIATLGKYVGNADLKLDDLKDAGAVRDVLDMFLADAGVDSEELNDAISQSTIANAILDTYYSAPVEKKEEEKETPVEEETIIPDTGFIG